MISGKNQHDPNKGQRKGREYVAEAQTVPKYLQEKSGYLQKRIIFSYLRKHIATVSMLAHVTGIPKGFIYKYARELKDECALWKVARAKCNQSQSDSNYLTTNPSKRGVSGKALKYLLKKSRQHFAGLAKTNSITPTKHS